MATREDYTPKQIRDLKKNPYTLKVTPKRLFFTADFKAAFYEKYKEGMRVRDILRDLGYDPALFSQTQLNGITHKIKLQGEAGEFSDAASNSRELFPIDSDLDPRLLEPTAENMARVWTKMKYLEARQEAFTRLAPDKAETLAQG